MGISVVSALIVLAIHVVVSYGSLRRGVLAYLVLALVMPNVAVSGLVISYEILASPLLLLLYVAAVASDKRVSRLTGQGEGWLILYFLLVFVSTAVAAVQGIGEFAGVVSAIGMLRALVLILVAKQLLRKRDVGRALLVIITVNLAAVAFQTIQPEAAISLFYKWYFKPSLTPLESQFRAGLFYRPSGTFGTPVDLGILSLLCFAWSLGRMLTRDFSWIGAYAMGAAILCGLSSLSKTFIVGAPVIYFIGLLLPILVQRSKVRIRTTATLAALSVISLGLWLGGTSYLRERGLMIDAQLEFQNRPDAVFESRYGDDGMLSMTVAAIQEYPVMGVGLTRIRGVFRGDSMYVSLLYESGVVGVLAFFAFSFTAIRRLWRNRDVVGLMLFLAFLLCGLGAPVHQSVIAVFGLAYPFIRARRDNDRSQASTRSAGGWNRSLSRTPSPDSGSVIAGPAPSARGNRVSAPMESSAGFSPACGGWNREFFTT